MLRLEIEKVIAEKYPGLFARDRRSHYSLRPSLSALHRETTPRGARRASSRGRSVHQPLSTRPKKFAMAAWKLLIDEPLR